MHAPLIRRLCTPALLRSDMYKKFNDKMIAMLEPLGLTRNQELIIQDIEVPVEKSVQWLRAFLQSCPSDKIGKIKLTRPDHKGKPTVPIWLCPVFGTASPLMPMRPKHLYVNFGFWDALEGRETRGGNKTGNINRGLEAACRAFGAKKTLYSMCFFTRDQFHEEYNGKHYDVVKAKYDPKSRLRGWYERLALS